MRIDRIDLLRYGHFSNRVIDIPRRQPDFFLIYGNNEAGKSTLLRGISSLFFGVPARTPDVHSCKGPELRIGATISDGERIFSFRRRKGVSGTLLNTDEAQIQEDTLAPFLRALDRDRFEQFFGLDHVRLREGGEELLRGKGEIGSALFQAAGFDLRKLLEALGGEAKEVFSPNSKKRIIGIALEEYRQSRAEVRKTSITASTVKEKQAELDQARERNEALNTEAQSLRDELTTLNRIAGNKSDVARLQDLRAALSALDWVPPLPANARRQRDEAAATLAEASSQIESLTGQIALRRERIAALPVSGVFKVHAQEIEKLNAGIQDYLRGVSDRPKRSAEREQAVQLAEAEWREVWRQRPVTQAEELRAAYSRKAEIRALITEHARLTTGLQQAEDLLRSGAEENERLSRELASHPEPSDPATLLAVLEQARKLGDTGEAIARLQFDLQRLDEESARELKALPRWSRQIDELDALQTPMLSTIEEYCRRWEAAATGRRELELRRSSIGVSIRGKQAELERMAVQVSTAGESELTEARAHRDRIWQLIRASAFDKTLAPADAQKQSGSLIPLPESFWAHARRADEIADLRFSNAKDVAIHDRLVKELALARAEQETVNSEANRREEEQAQLQRRWQGEWTQLGFDPLSPAEMKEWMHRRQTILERLEQRRKKEAELRSLQQRASAAVGQVRACAKKFQAASESDSLAVVLEVGESLAKEVQERRREIAEMRRSLQALDLESRRERVSACKTKLSEWAGNWSPLMSALLLPEIGTPSQASEALDVLERVFSHLNEANSLQHRIRRIGDNLVEFQNGKEKLVAAIDPSLAPLPPERAVAQLHARLVEIGKAETRRDELDGENAADEAALASCRAKSQAASAMLKKLADVAKCQDEPCLEAVIAAAEDKAAREENYKRIAGGLVDRNGNPDLKQIEEEASRYELDSLRREIDRREERERALREELFRAGAEYGRAQEEFARLEGSQEAALQTQKAEAALARLRPAIAQYLRLQVAAEVLQRAMDSYREKHQGPVLSRASDLFARLTLNEHSGLTTAFGSNDKPVLVAIRNSHEQVEVEGLSDGTRDQLYLALRLAAIEHHVESVAPCPIILDDVLIHSDDARATAALEVLASLAQRTQVLFFTHHRRLADLGIKAGAEILELAPRVAAAIA